MRIKFINKSLANYPSINTDDGFSKKTEKNPKDGRTYTLLGTSEKSYSVVRRCWLGIRALAKTLFSFGFGLLSQKTRDDWSACFSGKKIVAIYVPPDRVDFFQKQILARISEKGQALVQKGGDISGVGEPSKKVRYYEDRHTALAAVSEDGLLLQYASPNLKKDRDVVLAAVRQNGLALWFASVDLKKDKGVVLAAVQQNGQALRYAAVDLKKDKDVVLAAVQQDGQALGCALEVLQRDRDVVLAAVQQDGQALRFAAAALKKDKDVVLAAVQSSWSAFEYADGDLKKDEAILELYTVKKRAAQDARRSREKNEGIRPAYQVFLKKGL